MKTKLSTFGHRQSASTICGATLAAALIACIIAPRAPAQVGPDYALAFNGTNNYVAVNAQNVPFGNSPFYTIEAWIKPNSMGNVGIIGWGNYATTNQIIALSVRTNGLAHSWGGNEVVVITNISGAWHHVAATYDAITGRRIYLDGNLVASNTPPTPHTVTNRSNLTIGLVGTSEFFNGTIDEVRIWGGARNQAQIQTNRFVRLIGNELDLMAYWRFSEGSGTTVNDATGFNPGVLSNNPAWVRSTAPFSPEAVTTAATAITTASARLNAFVHAGNLTSKAWFQWGTTTSYGTNTPQFTVGPDLPADTNALTFAGSSVLTNLMTNTIYHYRIAVTNSVGTNYGVDMAVTTAPLPTGPGCALSLDGTNDYVVVTNFGRAVPTNEVTVEFWQRVHQLQQQSTFGLDPDDGNNRFQAHVALENGYVYWDFGNILAGGRLTYLSPEPLTNSWQHFALVAKAGAGGYMQIYRNGVLEANKTGAGSPYFTTQNLVLGMVADSFFLDGDLDEFRIWNVARTAAQVQADLYRPLAGNEPGLVAYWQFDECSGTLAADTTGHGYDGTLLNGPTWTNSTVQYGPAVTSLAATNLTTTGATLKGIVNPQGFATLAWFQYGTTTNYGTTTTVTNAGSVMTNVALSAGISGLVAANTYHFRAGASNSYNTVYGADQTFWLGIPLVTTMPASDTTTNAATLNGTVIPGGPSASAWFQWGLTTNYGNSTAVGNLGSGTLGVSVTNRLQPLISGSTYHYRIVSTNAFSGLPTFGADVAFTTPFLGQVANLAGAPSTGLAWGDFDNDGDLDIVVAGTIPNTKIYRNDGAVGFTDVSVPLTAVGYNAIAVGDYDNDGWLDLLLTGYTTNIITELWRNTGSGWVKTNTPLPGVDFGSVEFGDYDNDGRQDILLTGTTNGAPSGAIAQVWRNTGSGWSNINASLPGVHLSSVAWGDYDNDSWLDLLLTGSSSIGSIARVYHNNGNGTFANINANLTGVSSGCVAWGDYDNDGRLDILLAGASTNDQVAAVYHNNGDGTFTDIGASLPGVENCSVAWGDLDNDGWLDIVLTGTPASGGGIAYVYHNNGGGSPPFTLIPTAGLIGADHTSVAVGDYDKDGRLDILLSDSTYVTHVYHNYLPPTNNPPTAPVNLVASVAGTNAILSWNVAGDQQTPSPGLGYNLRVGSSPGGSNVVSPQAANTGFRRVPQLGNAQQNRSAILTGLKYGSNYYWSVQGVDAAFAGSPFANEVTFAVTLAPSSSPGRVGSVMGNSAVISASVYSNGFPTTAWIQWGTTPAYGNSTAPQIVGSGTLRQFLTGLQPGTLYHYRIVTSNANGTTYGPDQTFYLDPSVIVGDLNGDGMVDQNELDSVLADYWPTSPWLFMTNTAGLGGTNVTFALTNSTAGAYSVLMSTNLADWYYLGPATPRYEFTDTNAPALPQRFYQLRWP